ncbi:acyltransferase [Gordonia jinhuaensis]|uniref:Acyltransferase n=1 Tax=Gordonia jinhuaensis TaxID=1517702 RepID=A0A916TEU0_9ACTN|nr:acyltransferase [Gordonia jinhuaensis]GGB42255.1 acyltransferase [Gordonia jinhuaensis]
MRGTTFLAVIFTHTLAATTDVHLNVASNVLAMFFHFSRNTFFFLTGFVLTYANFSKSGFSARTFWPKRLKLIVIPYVLWSFIYWVYRFGTEGRLTAVPTSLDDYWNDLSRGVAAPHMYFLLVMIQVYLLFPALLWVLRKTTGHHRIVFAVSLALQVAIVATLTYYHPSSPWLAAHWWQAFTTFIPYQLFVVLGALVAIHRDEFADRVRGRGFWIFAALLASSALAWGGFAHRVYRGTSPLDSSAAFQPTLLPFLVIAALSLYTLGVWWADRRDARSVSARVIDHTSNRSFGIFLSHMLVLNLLMYVTVDNVPWIIRGVDAPWATLLVFVAVVPLTLALLEVLRRLPGSLYLTGRPRLPVPGVATVVAKWRTHRAEASGELDADPTDSAA